MEDKNKELSSKDNSLKYFVKLLFLVFIIIGFSIGIISITIKFISWFIYFFGYEIN